MTAEIPWVIDEHTRVKHALLAKYIDPWMAIFFRVQSNRGKEQKVVYLDGFCGPGTYYNDESKGDECSGSPLLVAEVANKYLDEDPKRSVIIHCVDRNAQCTEMLKKKMDKLNRHNQDWQVHNGEFDYIVHKVLDSFDQSDLRYQPLFFFIDPRGYSGYPMKTLERLLAHPRAELFINFMVYDIVRFWEQELFEKDMIALFGTDEFKKVSACTTPEQKYAFLVNLYSSCLLKAGAQYVMPFRVNTPSQGTRPRYYLVHASKDILALKTMKDNMAKISDVPYRFEAIGLVTGQMSLFEDPDKIALRDRIEELCWNAKGEAGYDEIENWAYANTIGVAKTIKEALVELEHEGKVSIIRRPGQRKSTVVSGARIRANK
ncbi:MAG: three-Cys-motif partner protein TcmP [Thermodesulfobacteriota bacterium]